MEQRTMPIWQRPLGETLASFVVFLVALPLSMGIAIACGLSPAHGLISAIVAGIFVGTISGSPLQVSGASASLIVFVCDLIDEYGIGMLGPVTIGAGVIQIAFGFLGFGRYFRMVSPAVLHGMLAGVGVLIVASQFHVMFDLSSHGTGFENIKAVPYSIMEALKNGSQARTAIFISGFTFLFIIVWRFMRLDKRLVIPGGLPAVMLAMILVWYFGAEVRMSLVPHSIWNTIDLPDWPSVIDCFTKLGIFLLALELALIASAESILSAVAVDQLQDGPRSQFNRELAAQGFGNVFCGFLGALPVTGAIVRSSVNVEAGAKSRWSTVLHGVWMLATVILLPWLLELIPVCGLAALVVFAGFRLINITAVKELWRFGKIELAIFAATALMVVVGGLLKGIIFGLVLASVRTLHRLSKSQIKLTRINDSAYELKLSGSLVFLNLPELSDLLSSVPTGSRLNVHFDQLNHIDHACLEELKCWEERQKASGGRLVVEWGELLGRHDKPLYMRLSHALIANATASKPAQGGQAIWTDQNQRVIREGERCIDQLARGAYDFSTCVYPQMAEVFKALESGQNPHTLFITCSDSRVVPELITLSAPGSIFTVRNAGCIVPAANASPTSEAASIEYALDVLKIKHVVLCGHSDCGAVKCLCSPHATGWDDRPSLQSWLSHAGYDPSPSDMLIREDGESDIDYAIKLHVLRQLEKVKGHRHVLPLLERGELQLQAWFYNIADGYIWIYKPELKKYQRLAEQ